MTKNITSHSAGWGEYATSTISVTLVLFILGLVGVINIAFNGIDRQLKEKMGFTAVLTDSIATSRLDSLIQQLGGEAYVAQWEYFSAEDVLKEETRGDSEELVALLGMNPYSPMIEVKLRPEYADADSLARILPRWAAMSEVAEVSANTEMIDNLNRNAHMVNIVLIVMAAALLLISFVLINNTVRLTVYARRFLIHTMKLVGAKGSFIRRPFLVVNSLQGVIAGILACLLIVGTVAWAHNWETALIPLLPWSKVVMVGTGLVLLGVMICLIAATAATNRYLRKNYDEMFS